MEGFETGSFGLQVLEAEHEIRPFSYGQAILRQRGSHGGARTPNKVSIRWCPGGPLPSLLPPFSSFLCS